MSQLSYTCKSPCKGARPSPGLAVLRAALGFRTPNNQPPRKGQDKRVCNRDILLPLQGGCHYNDIVTQGVALG